MIWAIIPACLKRAVALAVAGLAAIGGAWAVGRRGGALAAKNKASARNAEAAAKTKAVRDEVDGISGDDVSKRLSKWQRK